MVYYLVNYIVNTNMAVNMLIKICIVTFYLKQFADDSKSISLLVHL